MIILLVEYVCKEGCREAFLEAIKEQKIDWCSQNELGNLQYAYSFSAEDENVLMLTELWRDAEAVALHGKTSHFAELGELKKQYVEETKIKRFEATTFES